MKLYAYYTLSTPILHFNANMIQVLSSTNGPGFSLNGDFKSESSPEPAYLAGL